MVKYNRSTRVFKNVKCTQQKCLKVYIIENQKMCKAFKS